MPHRFLEVCDSIIIGVITTCAAIATRILAVESATGQVDELRILMVPMIGSLIATGGMMIFQLGKETRNVVIGRAMLALFFGTAFIPVMAVIFPSMAELLNRPLILLVGGALMSMVFYALAYPFSRGLFNRSDNIADKILDEAEHRSGVPINPDHTVREIRKEDFIAGAQGVIDTAGHGKTP